MLRENALRVELDPLGWMLSMSNTHDFSVVAPGSYLKALGQARFIHHERVIAGGEERGGESRKYARTGVLHRGGLPVHDLGGPDNRSSKDLAYGLMSQADAENGQFPTVFSNHVH